MQLKTIQWDFEAWEEYLYWQSQDKKMLKRINQLIKDIKRNPFEGIGKPEPLKENLTGFWSRRIDEEHRIVYAVEEESVIIISCKGHYWDWGRDTVLILPLLFVLAICLQKIEKGVCLWYKTVYFVIRNYEF